MSNQIMNQLQISIENHLRELEARGDIVITTPTISPIVDGLVSSLRHTYEGMYGEGAFTTSELEAIYSLIFEAVHDERFFDWEKPTLTGMTKDQFEALGRKIRDLT
ncbi:hypothetical protein CAI21_17315 [Alkalilimnicola ehrlichii]|uniref:Uncharacterized protein n=1 Tax=Alkalilimnicola ehrlichii TaxID=351052 RepID=A0A3E0WJT9_9GAMM|nr:hypothetical protein [Alkalilimnicola ehrlichii]RFA26239.1 hypothetical protein CAI21_17315 [Alkalilimnicola ehrlichii]RFA33224.1 hypothetical protein CAL65_17800 [Alkalilimnicola ehrlichii]